MKNSQTLRLLSVPMLAVLALSASACVFFPADGGDGGGSYGGGNPGGSDTGGGGIGEGGSGGGVVELTEVPLSGGQSCDDAEPVELRPGEVGVAQETTLDGTDAMKTFCGDPDETTSAPDRVFAIELPEACSLRVSVSGANLLDPVLELRQSACAEESGGDLCVNRTDLFNEYLDQAVEPGTYYVVVDGAGGTAGAFELRVECWQPACGDGLLNAGETCDYGGDDPYDGCVPPGTKDECQPVPADPALDTCAGAVDAPAIVIDAGQTRFVPSADALATTLGATDSSAGSCQAATGGRDLIYRVRPSAAGTLTVVLGEDAQGQPQCPAEWNGEIPLTCWDRALYVRSACADETTELACSDDPNDGLAAERVEIPVDAGQDYYVFVDGYNDGPYATGQFVLRMTLQ